MTSHEAHGTPHLRLTWWVSSLFVDVVGHPLIGSPHPVHRLRPRGPFQADAHVLTCPARRAQHARCPTAPRSWGPMRTLACWSPVCPAFRQGWPNDVLLNYAYALCDVLDCGSRIVGIEYQVRGRVPRTQNGVKSHGCMRAPHRKYVLYLSCITTPPLVAQMYMGLGPGLKTENDSPTHPVVCILGVYAVCLLYSFIYTVPTGNGWER